MKNRYKKIGHRIVFALCLFCSAGVFAQTLGFNYQAIISDPHVYQLPGENIKLNHFVSKEIAMRFSIINGSSTVEYMEEHFPTTNEFGEVNLIIGQGQASLGHFSDILWNGTPKQLKVEIDYKTGSGYQHSNTQELLYLPHPLNQSDAMAVDSNTQLVDAIKQAAGLDAEGNYVANPSAEYIAEASSLSEADSRLDAKVKANADGITNFSDNQIDLSLSGMDLTVGIEGGQSQTVDLRPLQDLMDDQTAVEVDLEEPLDMDGDVSNGPEITNVEAAIVELNKGLDALESAAANNQQLTLDPQTHILSLQEGGTVDLSPYVNTDEQNGTGVKLADSLDVDGDGDKEENVEEAITALIDALFGCTKPTACNYKAKPEFVNNTLCEDPEDGKNCNGVLIAPGVPYQGGVVFHIDEVNDKVYVVAKKDFDMQVEWSSAGSRCVGYENQGFDDWYLPSSEDLKRIYDERTVLNAVDGFVAFESEDYWSSTESSNSTDAKVVDMGSGSTGESQRSSSKRVRAIRSFDR